MSARVRVAVARALQALGDRDGATLERGAARKVFTALGARLDLRALEALSAQTSAKDPADKGAHGLSARELKVLLLAAAGKTKKISARELYLSEKTVDRRRSNSFTGRPDRAAAGCPGLICRSSTTLGSHAT